MYAFNFHCEGTVPDYIQTTAMFSEEFMESIASHFAAHNMGYYPPSEDKELYQSCRLFQQDNLTTREKVATFIKLGDVDQEAPANCFNLTNDLPPYPNSTISASDWSRVGGGPSGWFWDFQCCQLSPECGFSKESMFPLREWTLEWQTDHCVPRFEIKPDPSALVNEYGFDDLTEVTRLLFTNGLVDGWSAGSHTVELEEWEGNIRVVNMLNGAHHSDLTQHAPSSRDTPDVQAAYSQISKFIGEWLDEVKNGTATKAGKFVEEKVAKALLKTEDLTAADIPEVYFDEQLVNRNDPDEGVYSQRYYEVKDYFGGAGHPIFVIMAGEDDLSFICILKEHGGPYIIVVVISMTFQTSTGTGCGCNRIPSLAVVTTIDHITTNVSTSLIRGLVVVFNVHRRTRRNTHIGKWTRIGPGERVHHRVVVITWIRIT
jgi:hypothetical protein